MTGRKLVMSYWTYLYRIRLDELREIKRSFCQDSLQAGRDLH